MAEYSRYLQLLQQLAETADQQTAAQEETAVRERRSQDLANAAISRAETRAEGWSREIGDQLIAGRDVLQPVGQSNLVPPRLLPSAVPASATADDVNQKLAEVGRTLGELREAVRVQIEQAKDEEARARRETLDQERARLAEIARLHALRQRKRRFVMAAAIAILLIIIVIVLVLALT